MKGLYVLVASLMLAACTGLPAIHPPPAPGSKTVCPSVFAEAPTRFIHAIEARTAGQTRAVMIGVTLVHPRTGLLSSAIVSTEGLSLFEATSDAGGVKVSRALPPFDAPDFAQNMIDDIELIFLAPSGTLQQQGLLADGRTVCRWHREKGGWVDVSESADGRLRIQRYSEGGNPERTVTLATGPGRAYSLIELQASSLINYTLIMTLIESEGVAAAAKDEQDPNQTTEGKKP